MPEKIEKLQNIIDQCSRIVFFGGAGVSTESGIPDFRSKDGLYNQHDVQFDRYTPEYLLSRDCLEDHPDVFFEFYRQKLDVTGIEPNAAHIFLAKLEAAGKLKGVITQNIDGLHQKAGSVNVQEVHGSTLRNYCMRCRRKMPSDYIFRALNGKEEERIAVSGEKRTEPEFMPDGRIKAAYRGGIPVCPYCGGTVRPDVTLYGEGLPEEAWVNAQDLIRKADCLIIGGTSLAVAPASYLVYDFRGKYLVVINRDATPQDANADLVIHDSIGKVFSQIRIG